MADNLTDRVRSVVLQALADTEIDVEDVSVQAAGRRRLVRVLVDTDGGVSLDGVAEVTKVISAALDATNLMGESAYVLEVGSPGVDRPLTLPRHWRRNLGRLVRVRTTVSEPGADPLLGRIVQCDDERVTLLTPGDGPDGTRTEVLFADIAKAVVQVEFNNGGNSGHRH